MLASLLAELPEQPQEAARRLGSGFSEEMLAFVRAQGLLPLLAHYLPEQLGPCRQEVYAARFREARLVRVLRKVFATLEAAGIEAVALKGPVLAARIYPERWLRPTSDVDVLVRPADLPRALEALRAAGFVDEHPVGEVLTQAGHHSTMRGDGMLVELHFTVAGRFQFVSNLPTEPLFDRAVTVQFEGQTVKVLEPHDELAHLCVHAFDHAFHGLKWLFDLKLFLLEYPIDWETFVARVEAAGMAAPIWLALEQARRFGSQCPESVVRRLAPGWMRASLPRLLSLSESRVVFSWVSELVLADRFSAAWVLRLVTPGMVGLSKRVGLYRPTKAGLNWAAKRVGIRR